MKLFRNKRRRLVVVGASVALIAGLSGLAAAYFTSTGGGTANAYTGSGSTVSISQLTNSSILYDSEVSPLPQDMYSEAFTATGTSEFGNEINLASSGASLSSVDVTLSDWACETGSNGGSGNCETTPGDTFAVPVTLSIYAAPTTPSTPLAAPIATDTQTFQVPYRPSEDDTHCVGPNLDNPSAGAGDPNGEWYNGTTCSNGLNTNITFNAANFTGSVSSLPGELVYGISYPTTTTPEKALNVAVSDDTNDVTVGSDAITGDFLNSSEAISYCNSAPAQGTGVFQYDPYTEPCSGGNAVDNPAPDGTAETLNYPTGFWVPAVQFNAVDSGGGFTSLVPGGPSQPIDFSITNTGTSPAYVNTVAVALTGSNNPSCDLNWFTIVQPNTIDTTIPVGATVDFQPSGSSISLINEPYSQDACESTQLYLSFTSS
jgi:hypothetical protein